jgi:hypothetical protein
VFGDWTAVRSAIRRTLELSLELGPRLDQPAVAQRHEYDRVDLRVDQVMASGNEAECANVAGEDGNGLVGFGRLRERSAGEEEREQGDDPNAWNAPTPTHPHTFSEEVRHGKPHVNSCEDCRLGTSVAKHHRGNTRPEITFC